MGLLVPLPRITVRNPDETQVGFVHWWPTCGTSTNSVRITRSVVERFPR
jgi:hypothetical protein